MIPALQQFPRFEKGSPSTEYQQVINFCVNYLEGMLVGLIHMDIPGELEHQSAEIKPLQKKLMRRERTVRHAFQFQVEKYFSDFKSISRTRLRVNYPSGIFSGHKAAHNQDIIQYISDKHHSRHITQIQNTSRRLKTLVHRTDGNNEDNPISPYNLARAFLASIETLNLSSLKNRHLFELLDHTLSNQLGNFYDQIDLGLHYLDILTDLTDTSLFLKPEPDPEPVTETEGEEVTEIKDSVDIVNDDDTLLNTTLNTTALTDIDTVDNISIENDDQVYDSKVTSIENHSRIIEENRQQIENCLLEFKTSTENGTLDFVNIFAQLSILLNPLVEKKQRTDIQKFSHYFTSLLNNSLLTTPLKTQLSRLSHPLLEMVLIDPFFFRSSAHPVNDFIQSIIDFELRFKHQGESLAILSQVIDELLLIDKPSLSDYQPLIQKYEQFKELDVIRLDKIKEEKTQREEELKGEILHLINDITAELVVDQETLQFFYDDWQLILLHLAQAPGKDSAEFKNTINVAKMLSWFLDHNKTGFHPRFESTTFKSLLTSIEIGLVTLNFSGEHRHRIRKQLVKEYKLANDRQTFSVIPAAPKKAVLQSQAVVKKSSHQNIDESFFQLAKDLNMGDWVEIQLARDADFTRAKLKWKATDYSLFIFIDQRGHKINECDLTELSYEFSTGRIRLLKKPSFRQHIYF